MDSPPAALLRARVRREERTKTAVSPDAVAWAYRLLLDREPESLNALLGLCGAKNYAALRQSILSSAEYRANSPIHGQIGRYLERSDHAVEVEGSPEQLSAMLARIAREWRRYGETEPHWSVLVGDKFKPDRIAENIEEFYDSGRRELPTLINPVARAGLPAERFGTVLDFGCGVGRLTLALAAHADRVIGVDISHGHIALARERAEATGVGNAEFAVIEQADDLDRFRDIELVTSLIVLQHNPPPVMAVLLRKLLATLAPGGIAVVQLPTYIADRVFRVAHYLGSEQDSMEMNALPQKTVFEIVEESNCRVLEVREDRLIGDYPGVSQTFAIRRREG